MEKKKGALEKKNSLAPGRYGEKNKGIKRRKAGTNFEERRAVPTNRRGSQLKGEVISRTSSIRPEESPSTRRAESPQKKKEKNFGDAAN